MRRTPPARLLDLWERASRCRPHARALQLLAWALPDHELDELAAFDLGLRDWHLLRLRRALFGSRLAGYTDCPRCGERLEVELDAHALLGDAPPAQASEYVCTDGRRFRLPNSGDLIAIEDIDDVETAAHELCARCAVVDDAAASYTTVRAAMLDAATLHDIENGLTVLATERALRLELACAVCDETWLFDFDPAAFVWEEIEARATGLLDDVHALACAYGWSEREILTLSDTRRAAYLSRVN
jgi:hypothetical protein